MAEPRKINQDEQQCISACILEFWGDATPWRDDDEREQNYEKCLTECRICG